MSLKDPEMWTALGIAAIWLWKHFRGTNLSRYDKLVELGWHYVEGWATKKGNVSSADKASKFAEWWTEATGKKPNAKTVAKASSMSTARHSPSAPTRWW